MKLYLCSLTLILMFSNATSKIIDLSQIASIINSNPDSTWRASSYGYSKFNVDYFIETKFGIQLTDIDELSDIVKNIRSFLTNATTPIKPGPLLEKDKGLPKSYDAREAFPKCRSIGHIRDQSNCGSCWAVSATSVLADRLCIHSGGKQNLLLSAEHVLACSKENRGCRGGGLLETWRYLHSTGTVTGGDFHSDEGCQPYSIRTCGWPHKLPCRPVLTPRCRKTRCTNEWYDHEYEPNPFKVDHYYRVDDATLGLANEIQIRDEIYTNGPVQAAFLVFEDFLTYKSGIYKFTGTLTKPSLAALSVKLIGWGEENGIKYWLAVNSWGDEWGEKGTFKIIRGQYNCLIESVVYGAIPQLQNN